MSAGKVDVISEESFKLRNQGVSNVQTYPSDERGNLTTLIKSLCQDYDSSKLSFHLHIGSIDDKGANFCIQVKRSVVQGTGEGICLRVDCDNLSIRRGPACTQSGQQDISVLMNVCEGFESEQRGLLRVFPSVVRLQPLDDCNCFKGNSTKTLSPYFFIEDSPAIGDGELVRRSGFFVPCSDQFTYQIIQGRMNSLEHISENQRDLGRDGVTFLENAPRFGAPGILTLYHEFGGISMDIIRDLGTKKIEVV